ncbi:MAG: hypothetical protein JWR72_3341 [Flavisolibacter sp.]|jgi:hypothetical protein|nr:hypothetical protein [Flavisolibacter sp.]
MKKTVFFLALAICLWACNSAVNKEEITPSETSHQHDIVETKLVLNNGAKWNSDESTDKNVTELQAISSRFMATAIPHLADYATFSNEFQTGVDKMIKECRMQGEDHEALHHWLEPLLKQVADLKNATNEEEASKLTASVADHLNIYNQYFE